MILYLIIEKTYTCPKLKQGTEATFIKHYLFYNELLNFDRLFLVRLCVCKFFCYGCYGFGVFISSPSSPSKSVAFDGRGAATNISQLKLAQ